MGNIFNELLLYKYVSQIYTMEILHTSFIKADSTLCVNFEPLSKFLLQFLILFNKDFFFFIFFNTTVQYNYA